MCAGWSSGQVGRHVKCERRGWNGGGAYRGPLATEIALYLDVLFARATEFLAMPLPIQGRFEEQVRLYLLRFACRLTRN